MKKKNEERYFNAAFSLEEKIWLEEVDKNRFDLSVLQPKRTAVFISMKDTSRITVENMKAMQNQIRIVFLTLLRQHIDQMVISYGSKFGLLAMQTLTELKPSGLNFWLVCGKPYGEPFQQPDQAYEILHLMKRCDAYFSPLMEEEYLEQIIQRASVIVHEDGYVKTEQTTPSELYLLFQKRIKTRQNMARTWAEEVKRDPDSSN